MPDASCFSPDYIAARARFRSSAMALGLDPEAVEIGQTGPDGEPLTIDVVRLGSAEATRAVVVSSGLHGVEGFFGSAVQASLLEETFGGWTPPADLAIVLIHALNPYGFAYLRRVNEDNIDLNRNFLRPGEDYSGSPELYGAMDGVLNPKRPPSGAGTLFIPKMATSLVRHGMAALKNTIAGGQYDFPEGLFFGGSKPSRTVEVLREHLPRWLGKASRVLHVDFHTGLGPSATYKLLVDHSWGSEGLGSLGAMFGEQAVEPWEPKDGVSYEIRGGLGTWCKATFPHLQYDVLCAEFGTANVFSVISALHLENRAHLWGGDDHPQTEAAKKRLKNTFSPPETAWRDSVVTDGVKIVGQAIEALS